MTPLHLVKTSTMSNDLQWNKILFCKKSAGNILKYTVNMPVFSTVVNLLSQAAKMAWSNSSLNPPHRIVK